MFTCVTIMYENGISRNLDNAKIENHCNDFLRLSSLCLGIFHGALTDSIHLKNLITISLSINIADAVVFTAEI